MYDQLFSHTVFSPPSPAESWGRAGEPRRWAARRPSFTTLRRADRRGPAGQRAGADVEGQRERREARASRRQSPESFRVQRKRDLDLIGGDERPHHVLLAFRDVGRAGREPLAGQVLEIYGQDHTAWVVELGIGLHQRAGDLSHAGDVYALGRPIHGAEDRDSDGGSGEGRGAAPEQTAENRDEK